MAIVQLTSGWLPNTIPLDAEEDVTFRFDGLLDEIEGYKSTWIDLLRGDEDLTEVFSEFFVPADE